jgi:hypothetical protein
MKRNRQRAEAKQRRAARTKTVEQLEQAIGHVPRGILTQLAGKDDESKLVRHRWIFGHIQGLPKCPDGVSHPQIQAAAARALLAPSEMPAPQSR